MEHIIAQKILDLDVLELVGLLRNLEMKDSDAYNALKEALEDL